MWCCSAHPCGCSAKLGDLISKRREKREGENSKQTRSQIGIGFPVK
jgi:hypothetical protein